MKKKPALEKEKNITIDFNIKVNSNASSRKMALAKILFDKMALVKKNSRIKQPLLTSLQTELLYLYDQEPTEKQMKHFQVFRFYLFNDDYYDLTPKQEIEKKDLLTKKKLAVKREQLSPFQNELLSMYDHEPTEEQMLKLKDFLFKLFNNLLNKFDDKKEVEMVA
jgi:hypothetical protein